MNVKGMYTSKKNAQTSWKKQKRGYNATLSDEEEEESDSDLISNFVAFTAIIPNQTTETHTNVVSS